MNKVSLDTIKPWISERILQILGFEDDVVVEFMFNMLESHQVNVYGVCVYFMAVSCILCIFTVSRP